MNIKLGLEFPNRKDNSEKNQMNQKEKFPLFSIQKGNSKFKTRTEKKLNIVIKI